MNPSRLVFLGLALMTVPVASRTATAQEPTRQPLSTADSAAVVLGLARQVQAQGNRDLAQDLLRLVATRFPGTPASDSASGELRVLRYRATQTGGANMLAAWGALYGAWLGVAIPAALGADESGPYGAGILVGVPAGFFAGRGLARSAHLSPGQARAVVWGGLWGPFQAVGWRDVFGLGDRKVTYCDPYGLYGCYTYTEKSDRAPFTASILGGLAGIGTAALLARSREMSSGTISAVEWGSLWGTWFGAATALLLNVKGEHGPLVYTLIGGDLGLLTTALMAPRWNLTTGRPWLVSAAGLAGMLAGFGVDLLFEVSDDQARILYPLAGSVVGLAVGARATRATERGAAGTDPAPGALIQVWGGRPKLGRLTPIPAVLPAVGSSGFARWRPAVKIPVLSFALP